MVTDRWRRLLARHRRALAAATAAATVALAMSGLRPPDPATREVVVAAVDLPAGRTLTDADLGVRAIPVDAAPTRAEASPAALVGRVLAVPVPAGEPVTGTAVAGPESLGAQLRAGGPVSVAVPVRLGDAAAAALLRPGDVVDVWAARGTADLGSSDDPTATGASAGAASDDARRVAAAVRVIAVPAAPGGGLLAGDAGSSGIVVLAVPAASVAALAGAGARDRLSVAVLPG